MITQSYLTDLTYRITGACIEVHKILGPGLLESVYHKALKEEFNLREIEFVAEFPIEVLYKGKSLDCAFRCDFLIEDIMVFLSKKGAMLNILVLICVMAMQELKTNIFLTLYMLLIYSMLFLY